MKKLFKLFVASAMIIGAFLVGTLFFTAHAEELPAEETTTVLVESTESNTTSDTKSDFYHWIKSVDFATIKNWAVAFIAKCGIDTSVLIVMLIYFVKTKLNEAKNNEKYQKFKEQLDAEHQKKIEEIETKFNEQLTKLNTILLDTIKKQNSEKREIAKNNVDEMRAALGEIKVNLDE